MKAIQIKNGQRLCRLSLQFFVRKVREDEVGIIKLNLEGTSFGGKKCTELTLKLNFPVTECIGLKND